MISIVSIILTMSTFSYDEYNNWDKIAMSMPVSPKDVISAKFIIKCFVKSFYSNNNPSCAVAAHMMSYMIISAL